VDEEASVEDSSTATSGLEMSSTLRRALSWVSSRGTSLWSLSGASHFFFHSALVQISLL
jgi:hypothetical protein